MSHVYCSECGFQNPEVANYCARCGSLLREEDSDETTQSYTPEEEADLDAGRDVEGPALVIRSGGGRAGEHFALDDVTVSRRHAVALKQGDAFVIEDQGSLNGTFLNRRRIESAELSDDDELQIGKYRLVFFAR
jgi:pSer/pThr/pTyr-binding forkhead associated (FHA) protein